MKRGGNSSSTSRIPEIKTFQFALLIIPVEILSSELTSPDPTVVVVIIRFQNGVTMRTSTTNNERRTKFLQFDRVEFQK